MSKCTVLRLQIAAPKRTNIIIIITVPKRPNHFTKLSKRPSVTFLIRMGEHACVVEELRDGDGDFLVLFDICTSLWSAHNGPWRRCAVEFLTTLCRKTLTIGKTAKRLPSNDGCSTVAVLQ